MLIIKSKDNETYDRLGFETYRKIPVVVHAVKLAEPFEVDTLEGTMLGNSGDYLIMGVKGELYPCRQDIFEETYTKEIG